METGSNKQTASKACALSLVRQLFHLQVIEPFTGIKKKNKDEEVSIAASQAACDVIRLTSCKQRHTKHQKFYVTKSMSYDAKIFELQVINQCTTACACILSAYFHGFPNVAVMGILVLQLPPYEVGVAPDLMSKLDRVLETFEISPVQNVRTPMILV